MGQVAVTALLGVVLALPAYASEPPEPRAEPVAPPPGISVPGPAPAPIAPVPRASDGDGFFCRHYLKFIAGTFLLSGGFIGQQLHMDGAFGARTIDGHPHIGYGIYLDADTVASKAPSSVKKALEEYRTATSAEARSSAAAKVVEGYARMLSGDYDHAMVHRRRGDDPEHVLRRLTEQRDYLASPRLASTFLDGEPNRKNDRGVCRHKSVILARMLQHHGIDADTEWGEVQQGTVSRRGGPPEPVVSYHEWVVVRLPDGKTWVIDPTGESPKLELPEPYYTRQRIIKVRGQNPERESEYNLGR